jgi:hypothetical protein
MKYRTAGKLRRARPTATTILLLAGTVACGSSKVSLMVNRQVDTQKQETVKAGPDLNGKLITSLLETEFGSLFVIDDRTISPTYLRGDFNGDGVEDLAVAVRLNRQIDPNDRSKMPFQFDKAYGPGPSTVGEQDYGPTFTIGDLAGYRDLSMLAVIHGTREHGLTNSKPSQRFVVVDAWHLGQKTMSLFRGKLKPAAYGDELKIIPPPQLLGDAILMIGPEDSGTAVYWDGARYRWYEVPAPSK